MKICNTPHGGGYLKLEKHFALEELKVLLARYDRATSLLYAAVNGEFKRDEAGEATPMRMDIEGALQGMGILSMMSFRTVNHRLGLNKIDIIDAANEAGNGCFPPFSREELWKEDLDNFGGFTVWVDNAHFAKVAEGTHTMAYGTAQTTGYESLAYSDSRDRRERTLGQRAYQRRQLSQINWVMFGIGESIRRLKG